VTEPYYTDEFVTLYHGDCREVTEWLEADVLVTDPPYGLGDKLSGGWAKHWGLHEYGGLTWDAEAPSIVPTLPDEFTASVIWGGNYFPLPLSRGWLVWDKILRNFTSGVCELAWTSLDQPIRAFNYSHGQLANEGKAHPTQKPVDLMSWCIGFMPSGTIADPFAGSGSTLVAAKRLGRRAIGVELEERYCEIAAKRLAQGVLDFGGVA
jgi:DNA modification methylase